VQWCVYVGLHWVGSHIASRKISADTLKATTASQEDLLGRAVRWVQAPAERLPLAVVMPQAVRPAAGEATGDYWCGCCCWCSCSCCSVDKATGGKACSR
jgi:hypothetical protein